MVREHPALLKVTGGEAVGMSFGVATTPLAGELDIDVLYRAADARLYQAKEARPPRAGRRSLAAG